MGLFGRFFKKKQEIEEETANLTELTKWYNNKTQSKKAKLKQKIDQTKQKIIQSTQETKKRLNDLKTAKLLNPNIPERAKHFLNGNKEAYSKKISNFLDNLTFPEETEELEGFFNDFSVQIKELAQSIARPTQVLSEFLANETRAVALAMGNIEQEIEKLKEQSKKTGLQKIENTRDKINELINKQKKEQTLKLELSELQDEIKTTQKSQQNLKTEIELLKKDKELNKLKEKQSEIQTKIEKTKKEMLESFAAIETALKKYEHITFKHKEITSKYLKSPINALTNDLHLNILQTFDDLKESIESGKIEMKLRKTKKTINELKKLDKEKLGRFLTEYGQLHSSKRKIEEKIEQMDVIKAKKEKEKKLAKQEEKFTVLMSKMNNLQTEFNKINIQQMTKNLEEQLNNQFKNKIIISQGQTDQEESFPEQKQ